MKPLSIDAFCDFKFLSGVTFSPAGKSACFCVTEADKKNNGYKSCLYLKKGGRIKKLTSGGRESSFVYLDENTILFPGNREEKKDPSSIESRWYSISLDGGEAELAYIFPVPVSSIVPLPGGNLLVTATVFPGWEKLYTGDRKLLAAYKKDAAENADYEIISQSPWWWNGGTFTKGAYEGLFFYDGKKKRLTRITDINEAVVTVAVRDDFSEAYFLTTAVVPRLRLDGTAVLKRVNLGSLEAETVVSSKPDFMINGIETMKSSLALMVSNGAHGLNTDCDFYTLDYATGEISLLAQHSESIGSSVGSDVRYGGGHVLRTEGDSIYFISTRFDTAELYRLDESGKTEKLTDWNGSVDCFDVKNGNILAVALKDMKGQELYDGNGRQLTRYNEAALKDRFVSVPEPLNIVRDGTEIHGFVLKPMDYDPAKTYPVILDIHGGPKTVYGPVFYHEMQYWAGQGCFVIFCNPTGSDGRGAFMDIFGRYGTVDYEDIMAFCDAALEAFPQMDREHFYETGGSYGGFMTNWIIGHTDRFRACVSQRSISDWFSFYGVSDIGTDFAPDQIHADPWHNPEKLWFHSPMKYADRVKTPTLFIHSFEDYRCPIDQGYQMFTALIDHGVEAKMVCFRGENHELSRSGKPLHRIKRLREITSWFDTHK